jgi:hypothetical protein
MAAKPKIKALDDLRRFVGEIGKQHAIMLSGISGHQMDKILGFENERGQGGHGRQLLDLSTS